VEHLDDGSTCEKPATETIRNLRADPNKRKKSTSGILAVFCSIEQNTAKIPLRIRTVFSFQLAGNFFEKSCQKVARSRTSETKRAQKKVQKKFPARLESETKKKLLATFFELFWTFFRLFFLDFRKLSKTFDSRLFSSSHNFPQISKESCSPESDRLPDTPDRSSSSRRVTPLKRSPRDWALVFDPHPPRVQTTNVQGSPPADFGRRWHKMRPRSLSSLDTTHRHAPRRVAFPTPMISAEIFPIVWVSISRRYSTRDVGGRIRLRSVRTVCRGGPGARGRRISWSRSGGCGVSMWVRGTSVDEGTASACVIRFVRTIWVFRV